MININLIQKVRIVKREEAQNLSTKFDFVKSVLVRTQQFHVLSEFNLPNKLPKKATKLTRIIFEW